MYYQVQVALDPAFKDIVVNKVVEDTTDYQIVKDLEPFTVYYWRVKAIDPLTGGQSEWSTPCAFRVKAQDLIIEHDVEPNSYIWYYGLEHKFVRSTDTECVIPQAQIGVGMENTSMEAQIGVDFCPGVCTPTFDGFEIEVLFTEDNHPLYTEDGYMIGLEF